MPTNFSYQKIVFFGFWSGIQSSWKYLTSSKSDRPLPSPSTSPNVPPITRNSSFLSFPSIPNPPNTISKEEDKNGNGVSLPRNRRISHEQGEISKFMMNLQKLAEDE